MPRTLPLQQLAAKVVEDPTFYPAMVRNGWVRAEDRWMHLPGAGEYVLRLSQGDVAPEDVIAQRRGPGGCGDCPHRTASRHERTALGYCGPELESRVHKDPATCGCVVEGLTSCASRDCPLDDPRWRRVPPLKSI